MCRGHMSQNPQNKFILNETANGLSSLKRKGDPYQSEFIRPGKCLGLVKLKYKQKDNWIDLSNEGMPLYSHDKNLCLQSTFENKGTSFDWNITLKNTSDSELEIGSLELPFEFNE